MNSLNKLVQDLGHPGMPWEIAALSGCLVLAFGVCWLLGRQQPPDSVWFGRATVDGLLFPLLALVLTYTARHVVDDYQRVVLLRIGVPI
ncbi:MAG TPA: mechanosensitive ion channel protein, partial [Ramlibacter sp.]|nr:mechanosensitive ion channel protein [Ramlibacter sp.]